MLAVLCSPLQSIAQQRCGIVEHTSNLRTNKGIPENDAQFEQWLNHATQQRLKLEKSGNKIQSVYQIPVVVHVIHNGESVGNGTNIPEAQVLSQIRVLNADYQRTNNDASNTPSEFQSVAGSMSIEFVLAKRTPDGFPTNGIVRAKGTKSSWTSNDDVQLKALSYWPSEDYLNIWVCNLTDYLGYAQFPVSDIAGLQEYQDGLAVTDGAVFAYRVFGSIEDGAFNLNSKYNRGRTATHELGHFFGLRHTWGDDGGASSCSGTDYVNDTPNQDTETYNCPTHPQASCNVTKMFQNYLDYTDDACMNLFTKGQVSRMITVLESSPRRESLLTSPGLLDPNAEGNDLLIGKVIAPSPVTCSDRVVPKLLIKVNHSIETITSFTITYSINDVSIEETFPDNNLEEGDEVEISLPEIQLVPGENTLSFEVNKPNEGIDINPFNNTKSTSAIINTQQDVVPLRQDFEQAFEEAWTIANPIGGMNWQAVDLSGNTAIYMNAFTNTVANDESWLVSPVLDFTSSTEASMSFDLSYAYRSGKFDTFKVLASRDCGTTFDITLLELTGPTIASRTSTTAWQPASADDWEVNKNISLEDLAEEGEARVAFVFTNQNGNNLYLDNIEFFQYENPITVSSRLAVSPNPASAEVSVRLNLPQREDATVTITDVMGKIVSSQSIQNGLNQNFTFQVYGINPGLYLVWVKTSSGSWSSRLLVQ